jgi:site-specific DNA-methyltransferase (adenine-specific)
VYQSGSLYLADATEGLRSLEDASVDLIITDPAYDTLEKWRAQGTTTRLKKSKSSSNEWFPVVPPTYFDEFFIECFRVLKRDTHLYVFCDPETLVNITPKVQCQGFGIKKPLVWHKVGRVTYKKCDRCGHPHEYRGKGSPGMGYPYRSCYELILFAQKGKRKPPENKGVRDVLEVPRIKDRKAYPTEKPVELLRTLIQQSSHEGDLIVDPFAGSGSTIQAGLEGGRRAFGFDIQQSTIDRFNAQAPDLLSIFGDTDARP